MPTTMQHGDRLLDAPDGAIVLPLDPAVLSRVFTEERVRLFEHVRTHGPMPSLQDLADGLGRQLSHVSADVTYLTGLGLLQTRRTGRTKQIAATEGQIIID